MSASEFLLALVVGVTVVGASLVLWVFVRHAFVPWLQGWLKRRHEAVVDPVDAQLDSNPREDRDESREPVHPLMREIYAALSLAREGVDIERGARKEWVP